MTLLSHRFAHGLGDGFHPGRSCVFHKVSTMQFASGLPVGSAFVLVTDAFLRGEQVPASSFSLKALPGSPARRCQAFRASGR